MEFKHTNLPIESDFPKLVRDRIPELIRKNGQNLNETTIEKDEEFLQYLLKKLVEEAVELHNSLEVGNLEEELADIYEVIDTIIKLNSLKIKHIKETQTKKREEKGGFDKRILMIGKK